MQRSRWATTNDIEIDIQWLIQDYTKSIEGFTMEFNESKLEQKILNYFNASYGVIRNVRIWNPSGPIRVRQAVEIQNMFDEYFGSKHIHLSPDKLREIVLEGVFLVLSTSMLGKLKRGLTKFIRRTSRKLCLVFDESDEITNPSSQRTRHILGIFRRLKYKILDTGTTTRNNIAELYSQFELLYNNSINMICWCSRIYHENGPY
jgi:hypothetical protein